MLAYRELGFGLDDIAALLAGDRSTRWSHLRRQHELVRTRIDQLTRLLGALETTMEAQMSGLRLTPEERFEVFGDHDPEQYADEARDRWGDTDAYRQSAQRTSRYTKDDWLRIKAEGEAVTQRFQDLFAAGAAADGPEAAQAVREHREHISRWFYDCSARRCSAVWPRCTSPTTGSAATTTTGHPAWPSGSTTRSSPRPPGPESPPSR